VRATFVTVRQTHASSAGVLEAGAKQPGERLLDGVERPSPEPTIAVARRMKRGYPLR
jgi:hypothetical protein